MSQSWKIILSHDLFSEETGAYDWIQSEHEDESTLEETVSKIFTIFVERSSILFADESILLWLREIIGFTLNKIDSGEIEADMLLAQLQSGIVESHFTWSRYRLTLKTADFMDDLSIVNAQDLMHGPQVAQQLPEDDQNQNFAEQQLNQMINQLNTPVNPMMAQQQQPLIQEGINGEMDQEEFEQLQAALVASMNQENEEIVIADDDEEEASGGVV